jgi:hypothetical protein
MIVVTLGYYGEPPGLQEIGQNVQEAMLPGTDSCKRKEASQDKGRPSKGKASGFPQASQ